jgi:hypothetical protein
MLQLRRRCCARRSPPRTSRSSVICSLEPLDHTTRHFFTAAGRFSSLSTCTSNRNFRPALFPLLPSLPDSRANMAAPRTPTTLKQVSAALTAAWAHGAGCKNVAGRRSYGRANCAGPCHPKVYYVSWSRSTTIGSGTHAPKGVRPAHSSPACARNVHAPCRDLWPRRASCRCSMPVKSISSARPRRAQTSARPASEHAALAGLLDRCGLWTPGSAMVAGSGPSTVPLIHCSH